MVTHYTCYCFQKQTKQTKQTTSWLSCRLPPYIFMGAILCAPTIMRINEKPYSPYYQLDVPQIAQMADYEFFILFRKFLLLHTRTDRMRLQVVWQEQRTDGNALHVGIFHSKCVQQRGS